MEFSFKPITIGMNDTFSGKEFKYSGLVLILEVRSWIIGQRPSGNNRNHGSEWGETRIGVKEKLP